MSAHHTPFGILITSFLDADWSEMPFGLRQTTLHLGSEDQPDQPILVMTRFPPDVDLPRHSHAAPFCDAVVEGSMWVEDDGQWYPRGTVRMVPAGTTYGPTRSGAEGLTLLEFYANAAGFPAAMDIDAMTEDQRAEISRWRAGQATNAS